MRLATIIMTLALSTLLASCAPSLRESTRLTTADLLDVTEEIASSLRATPVIASRTPNSEPWRVTIDRVTNLSSDIIPESEQWLLVERVRGSLPLLTLAEDRNIRFVIPAAQAKRLREAYDVEAPVLRDRDPTHRMSATIRSITRNDGIARTDLYAFSYDLVEIDSGALIWNDSFDIKREAFGRSWD